MAYWPLEGSYADVLGRMPGAPEGAGHSWVPRQDARLDGRPDARQHERLDNASATAAAATALRLEGNGSADPRNPPHGIQGRRNSV